MRVDDVWTNLAQRTAHGSEQFHRPLPGFGDDPDGDALRVGDLAETAFVEGKQLDVDTRLPTLGAEETGDHCLRAAPGVVRNEMTDTQQRPAHLTTPQLYRYRPRLIRWAQM